MYKNNAAYIWIIWKILKPEAINVLVKLFLVYLMHKFYIMQFYILLAQLSIQIFQTYLGIIRFLVCFKYK